MTVMTYLTLKEGAEPEWDRIMEERLAGASERKGWVRGEILMPLDGLNKRVIVGTWRSRAEWEAWHEDPTFKHNADQLEALQLESNGPQWHEVVSDVTVRRTRQTAQALAERALSAMSTAARRVRAISGHGLSRADAVMRHRGQTTDTSRAR
jgi:heme-degrading monooxygenase HmoA